MKDVTNVLLHHYPFAEYRAFLDRDPLEAVRIPPDDGSWLLHWHVHELWKKRDRMINVGVDVWNDSPVAWGGIVEFMNRGENQVVPGTIRDFVYEDWLSVMFASHSIVSSANF